MRWRTVYHGAYAVSDAGIVQRALPGQGTRPGALVKPAQDPNGYHRVCLSYRCQTRWIWLHRLVAEAFLGPCPEGHQVNHRDGDKRNNVLANLEYVTPSENMQHAIRTGLRTPMQSSRPGVRNGHARVTDEDVRNIRAAWAAGESGPRIASRFGITRGTAHKIATGKAWKHVQ